MARKDASIWRYIKDWLRQRHWQDAYESLDMEYGFIVYRIRYYLHFGTPDQKEMALSLLDEVGK